MAQKDNTINPKWLRVDAEIEAAQKEANKNTEDNYLVIEFRFAKYVLPYKDGINLLSTFKNAETIKDIEWDYKKIMPISDDSDNKINAYLLSKEDYIEMKMRHLLKITKKPPKPEPEDIPF